MWKIKIMNCEYRVRIVGGGTYNMRDERGGEMHV